MPHLRAFHRLISNRVVPSPHLTFFTLASFLTANDAVGATIVSGSVSGTWGASGSPYLVEGNLLVESGEQLTIDAGVEVRFRGPYRLLVNGTVEAVGTEVDSILFTRDEPTSSMEWRGIRLVGADPATRIEYCRIEHVRSATNFPDVRGGAIYCELCSPVIRNCLLQHNVSRNSNSNGMGGGVAAVEASPTIEDCEIRENLADSGGGIAVIEAGTAIIRGNRIHDNEAPYSGGGVYAGVRSSAVIENNIIRVNHASGFGGGGIVLWNWYAAFPIKKTVRNNIVEANSSTTAGGGFYIRYDYSRLENNTVVDNTASTGGGLYVLNQGAGDFPPDVYSHILWGNSAGAGSSIYLEPSTGSAVRMHFSDVEGGWPGIGMMNEDPLFLDALFHLAPESPCIDSGDPDLQYYDACFPPSQGQGQNDMGVYGGPVACNWGEQTVGILEGSQGPIAAVSPTTLWLTVPAVTSGAIIPVEFAISGVTTDRRRVSIELVDTLGRSVGGRYVEWADQTPKSIDVDAGALSSGVYFLRLSSSGESVARRVLLVR